MKQESDPRYVWALAKDYCPLRQAWLSPVDQAKILAAYGSILHSTGQIECISTQLSLAMSRYPGDHLDQYEQAIADFGKRLNFLTTAVGILKLSKNNISRFERLVRLSRIFHKRYRNHFAHGYVERIGFTGSGLGVQVLRYRKTKPLVYTLHTRNFSMTDIDRAANLGIRLGRGWLIARDYAGRLPSVELDGY